MTRPSDIISYLEMCGEEGVNLQRGMNYRLRGSLSVILMSLRPGAPYADMVLDNGRTLIYEGHDSPSCKDGPNPKFVNQPMTNPSGTLTQNGLFYEAAMRYRRKRRQPELVKVYEKIKNGIWAYNGLFRLVDARYESVNNRKVFKFKLEIAGESETSNAGMSDIDHSRLIPASVKLEVWKRDRGQCVICGSKDNLHFDHIIPFSRGGSSLVAENIQLLCVRHNLEKKDKIE